MQILNLQNNKKNQHFPIFGAYKHLENIAKPAEDKISKKSIKLISALDEYIDNTWGKIKKNEIMMYEPRYSYCEGKNSVFIKPVYTQKYPALSIEHHDGKYTERILMNRNNPNLFKYEKTTETQYGYATLKSYNSELENNPTINSQVDNLILNYIKPIIPIKVLLNYFPKKNFRIYNDKFQLM